MAKKKREPGEIPQDLNLFVSMMWRDSEAYRLTLMDLIFEMDPAEQVRVLAEIGNRKREIMRPLLEGMFMRARSDDG